MELDDDLATVTADGRRGTIERRLLRPALRGDTVAPAIAPGRRADGELRIVWTHDGSGAPLRALPPSAARWLAQWRPRLERRRDARARQPWWTLHRTEAARCESPRVVWADIGRRLRPRVLAAGDPTVPLNSCYVLRATSMQDAAALETLLASKVAARWFEALAEPARGGFRRFMGWTVATLPVPEAWTTARLPLAELSTRRASGETIDERDEISIIAGAYGIAPRQLAPLLAWGE